MAEFKIEGGDFPKGKAQYSFGSFTIKTKEKPLLGITIPARKLDALEPASEEAAVRLGGAAGWGAAGALLLGPAGLLAGLVLGGRGKKVTFIAVFKNGKKFLGTAPQKTFNKMNVEFLKNSM